MVSPRSRPRTNCSETDLPPVSRPLVVGDVLGADDRDLPPENFCEAAPAVNGNV